MCLSVAALSDSFTVQIVVKPTVLSHADIVDPTSPKEARLELLKAAACIALTNLFKSMQAQACVDVSTVGVKTSILLARDAPEPMTLVPVSCTFTFTDQGKPPHGSVQLGVLRRRFFAYVHTATNVF